MTKLSNFWEELKTSFWFIPALMLLLAIVASFGFIYLDNQIEYYPDGFLKYLVSGSADSARSTLSIIASAMIGVAGTVFSITLVVLALASSQLGSRLLRNFMYDTLNQVVLGTYVSTFVYCLLISNSIKNNDDFNFVPVISVFVALIAALAGIILLIIFIHHISVSIQSNRVISDIAELMLKNIRKLFPDKIGEENKQPDPDVELLKMKFTFRKEIPCGKSGYLQSISSDDLMDLAKKEDLIIILHYRPGHYLVKDLNICEILCNKEPREDLTSKINGDLIIGKVRTPFQDAEFSIYQLVEIASRALSPGVNDPHTAIACIDNLTSLMSYLTSALFPSPFRYDKEGKLRIIADSLTFAGMLDASFNQIRQYAVDSPSVFIRLMEALIIIHQFAENDNQKKELFQHAKMIMNAAERSFEEPRDINDLKERFYSLDSN